MKGLENRVEEIFQNTVKKKRKEEIEYRRIKVRKSR